MSLELSGTTPAIKGVAGSVSAPAITGDDADTGISFPAADTIKFSAGGVEKFAITASGLSGDGSGLTGISGGGITLAQTFRRTSTTATNGASNYLTGTWEKSDNTAQGGIGSFDLPSSGIFTFPSTGFYFITFQTYFEDSTYSQVCQIKIDVTGDNNSYSTVSAVNFGTQYDTSGYTYQSAFISTILDITDVTNQKVRFGVYSNNTVSWDGSDTQDRTAATFIRLGDT